MSLERLIKSERSGLITSTWYVLQGPRGAVQFYLMVPHDRVQIPMMAVDLGIHSPVELYEGMDHTEDCPHTPTGTCYYQGSTRLAEDLLRDFQRYHDPEIIWRRLEGFYGAL